MPLKVGEVVEGVVKTITNFGAFVDLGDGVTGLVHISEVSDGYVKDVSEFLSQDQKNSETSRKCYLFILFINTYYLYFYFLIF